MKKIILSVLSLCIASNLIAAPIDELTQKLGGFSTMTASFTQQVSSQDGGVLQVATGTTTLKRPGKFRWEQTTPTAQLIIVNDNKATIYDPDLEQATVRSLKDSANDMSAILLSGSAEKILTLFEVTLIPSEGNSSWFKLASKSPNALTTLVLLNFKNGAINELQMQDTLGHITDIHFSDVKLNVTLDKSLFIFNPPEGVDVLNE